MNPYVVKYYWPKNHHEVYPFVCMADNAEHAIEQCEDAYPNNCHILSVDILENKLMKKKKVAKKKKPVKQKIDVVLESLLNLEQRMRELINRVERLESIQSSCPKYSEPKRWPNIPYSYWGYLGTEELDK